MNARPGDRPMTGKLSSSGDTFRFATKATTLERLAPYLTQARLCDQIIVSAANWQNGRDDMVNHILNRFAGSPIAVRSSAACEDTWDSSHAGAHSSNINVEPSRAAVIAAIDDVFQSYRNPSPDDQVLVQPMAEGVVISGVVLTRDLDTGSPYYVVNYDDMSGRTDTVTGGTVAKTFLVHRSRPDAVHSPRFRKLIASVMEIESITGTHELDIEFCITDQDEVYVLQVRPLAARRRWSPLSDGDVDRALDAIRDAIGGRMTPKHGLAGSTTILGEMPDWNPAEMIGNTPRPLALSLYKYLITERIWADARADMGYRRVEEPLLVDYYGHPYVDVRLSFNSFLPANLDAAFAHRLVDHQLARLNERPDLHDKIEFEIAITCRDFSFRDARDGLRRAGFGSEHLDAFEGSLAVLTARALAAWSGRLDHDLALANCLFDDRHGPADLSPTENVRRLLDDCRRFGTLPFARLARHGFIGVLFLRSLVERGVFTEDDRERFMRGIETVAADLIRDLAAVGGGTMDQVAFLARYGHLRPGTYDILSWRYDERPDLYLSHARRNAPDKAEAFEPTAKQRAGIEVLLAESGYDLSVDELLTYITAAVKAREQAKFAFSRSVSDSFSILVRWGEQAGLSREDVSFLPIDVILAEGDPAALNERVAKEKEAYKLSRAIRLPHLIRDVADVDVVRLHLGHPTFITGKSVTAPARPITALEPRGIDGYVVLIESADPGFDWIFSYKIAGLVTKYGGANSHMAIRCAEFGLPAAIGCGERLYETLVKSSVIDLDCAARKVSGH